MNKSKKVRSSQDIGELISQARKSRGQTQRQLAAEFGVSQAWLSRVELGQQKAWIGQVLRLAIYLGIEIEARIGMPQEQAMVSNSTNNYPDLNDLF